MAQGRVAGGLERLGRGDEPGRVDAKLAEAQHAGVHVRPAQRIDGERLRDGFERVGRV